MFNVQHLHIGFYGPLYDFLSLCIHAKYNTVAFLYHEILTFLKMSSLNSSPMYLFVERFNNIPVCPIKPMAPPLSWE